MKSKKTLTSSMEDYLEAIALLKKSKGIARVRDIGRLLGVKTPSVTGALAVLADNGLIIHERYGYVELTAQGRIFARNIQARHDMLVRFLTKVLNIEYDTARKDACKMEHSISEETFDKLTKFIDFIEGSHRNDQSVWLKEFNCYLKDYSKRKTKIVKRK